MLEEDTSDAEINIGWRRKSSKGQMAWPSITWLRWLTDPGREWTVANNRLSLTKARAGMTMPIHWPNGHSCVREKYAINLQAWTLMAINCCVVTILQWVLWLLLHCCKRVETKERVTTKSRYAISLKGIDTIDQLMRLKAKRLKQRCFPENLTFIPKHNSRKAVFGNSAYYLIW